MSNDDPNASAPEGTPEPPTTQSATPAAPDEVTTLKSRLQGQDAKITSLTTAQSAAEARAAAAEAKLAEYEQGKLGADEALRAQLEAEKARTAAAEQKAALALVKAEYPEAFKELGDAAALLSPDKLASIEARLSGVAAEPEPPTPRGNNPSGSRQPAKPLSEEAELAEMRRLYPTWK